MLCSSCTVTRRPTFVPHEFLHSGGEILQDHRNFLYWLHLQRYFHPYRFSVKFRFRTFSSFATVSSGHFATLDLHAVYLFVTMASVAATLCRVSFAFPQLGQTEFRLQADLESGEFVFGRVVQGPCSAGCQPGRGWPKISGLIIDQLYSSFQRRGGSHR